jgi:hypothetical protein
VATFGGRPKNRCGWCPNGVRAAARLGDGRSSWEEEREGPDPGRRFARNYRKRILSARQARADGRESRPGDAAVRLKRAQVLAAAGISRI